MKLNWKKKWLNDKSGYWFSAKVKPLNWEYIIDNSYDYKYYEAFLFLDGSDLEVKISKKNFKTVEAAQKFCEGHLDDTVEKLQQFLEK